MEQQRFPEKTPNIQIDFPTILADVKNYTDIENAIKDKIAELKTNGIENIGFVSGKIDGEEDRLRMRQLVIELREGHKFPIFASTDIFGTVWKELEETKLPQEDRKPKMLELFDTILRSGITDIFMMKGWKGRKDAIDDKNGAVAEHNTAKIIGINIKDFGPYFDNDTPQRT